MPMQTTLLTGTNKPVYIRETYTSPAAPIPHIGSKGWLCKNQQHREQAEEYGRVCVLFRQAFTASSPYSIGKVLGPIHILFPRSSLSQEPLDETKVAEARKAFLAKYRREEAERHQEAELLRTKLKTKLKTKLTTLNPEAVKMISDLWNQVTEKTDV